MVHYYVFNASTTSNLNMQPATLKHNRKDTSTISFLLSIKNNIHLLHK